MTTLRAATVRVALRIGVKHVIGARLPLAWRRAYLEAVARSLPLPEGVIAGRSPLGGIPSARLRPTAGASPLHVLHFHGGGFVAGSPRLSLSFAGHLARTCGCVVDLPDYRKAPEHPYPAALQDAWTAYRHLITSGTDPRNLVVAGDSAGAALALGVALRARDEGFPAPVALVLLSPWIRLDVLETGDELEKADPVLSAGAVERITRLYAPPDRQQEASPAKAPLTGLPPLVVHCGEREILRPQAEELVARARAAAVPITYWVLPGMWHTLHLMAAVLPEARHAVDVLADELAKAVARRRREYGR
ncbi:alpha/beta hydrolase fold domain-containing protein [Spirillospora sp. NPDC050679]